MSLSKMYKEMIKIGGEKDRTDVPMPDPLHLPMG
jgi:hypothetical protein